MPLGVLVSDGDEDVLTTTPSGFQAPRNCRAVRAHRTAVEGAAAVRAGRISRQRLECERGCDVGGDHLSSVSGATVPNGDKKSAGVVGRGGERWTSLRILGDAFPL